jgi:hypothetical protein
MKNIILAMVVLLMCNANAFAEKEALNKNQYDPQFSLKFDYAPSTYFSSINWFGKSGKYAHGGGLTVDWRGEDQWGAQGFGNYHHIGDIEVLALGGNAVYHFRDDHKNRIDPYLLIGGQFFFKLESSSEHEAGFIPVMNLGSGINFALTKHLGFHVDAMASPLIFILPLVILEGRAGIVITF